MMKESIYTKELEKLETKKHSYTYSLLLLFLDTPVTQHNVTTRKLTDYDIVKFTAITCKHLYHTQSSQVLM